MSAQFKYSAKRAVIPAHGVAHRQRTTDNGQRATK